MNSLLCEVCNAEPAVGVASCLLAQPISVAYGKNCLEKRLEARHVVIGTIFCIGRERKDFARWALDVIDRNLEFYGLTWDQAVAQAFFGAEE